MFIFREKYISLDTLKLIMSFLLNHVVANCPAKGGTRLPGTTVPNHTFKNEPVLPDGI